MYCGHFCSVTCPTVYLWFFLCKFWYCVEFVAFSGLSLLAFILGFIGIPYQLSFVVNIAHVIFYFFGMLSVYIFCLSFFLSWGGREFREISLRLLNKEKLDSHVMFSFMSFWKDFADGNVPRREHESVKIGLCLGMIFRSLISLGHWSLSFCFCFLCFLNL